jgi:hypothetical protein
MKCACRAGKKLGERWQRNAFARRSAARAQVIARGRQLLGVHGTQNNGPRESHTLGGGPRFRAPTKPSASLASSIQRWLEGARRRRGSRRGRARKERTWLVPADGAVEGEPANGADSDAGGGRDAVRAGRGGAGRQSAAEWG